MFWFRPLILLWSLTFSLLIILRKEKKKTPNQTILLAKSEILDPRSFTLGSKSKGTKNHSLRNHFPIKSRQSPLKEIMPPSLRNHSSSMVQS